MCQRQNTQNAVNRILAISYEIADLQAESAESQAKYTKRINALLDELRAILSGEVVYEPPKSAKPKRKRRSKAEMERDVTDAIRYLIDEEYNGATQSGTERRFGLPAGILSKGKWAAMIEKYRIMR